MNTQELESILRAAPRPPVPAGLQERLISHIRLRPESARLRSGREGSWIRRWWPTLLVGGGVLACAATFFSQHGEIQRLQSQLASLTAATTERDAGSPGLGGVVAISESSPTAEDKRAEIERLRAELAELNAVAAQGAQLLAERRQLEAQLAARSGLAPDELSALDQARDRAKSIKCVNNLKNIGLALRIWATDREGSFPMDFLSLTNELATPKLLICPADTAHSEAPDWSSFNTSHVSYEFLAPGGGDDEPHRVAARCTFHRHICLTDGSVQMSQGDGSNLTQRLVTRNGKVYYEEPR